MSVTGSRVGGAASGAGSEDGKKSDAGSSRPSLSVRTGEDEGKGAVIEWPTVPEVKKMIADMDFEQVALLAETMKPPPVLVATGAAMCTLVGQEPTWPLAKHILNNSRFFEAMARLKPERIEDDRRDTIRHLLLEQNVLWQARDSDNAELWTIALYLAVMVGMEAMPNRPVPKLSPKSAELVELREKVAVDKIREDVSVFALAHARRLVAIMHPTEVAELWDKDNRSDDVIAVCALICLAFDTTPTFKNAKDLIKKPQFGYFLVGMNPENIKARNFMVMRNLILEKNIAEVGTSHELPAVRALASWLAAVVGAHSAEAVKVPDPMRPLMIKPVTPPPTPTPVPTPTPPPTPPPDPHMLVKQFSGLDFYHENADLLAEEGDEAEEAEVVKPEPRKPPVPFLGKEVESSSDSDEDY